MYDFQIDGRQATILGWGGTEQSSLMPSCHLLEADIKVMYTTMTTLSAQVDHKLGRKCPATSDSKICVHHGDLKPAKTCDGDSGGPLLVNEGGMGVLIGVSSYSPRPTCPKNATSCVLGGNCDKSGVAIFTKVQYFLPWIKNITSTSTSTGIGEHEPFFV